MAILLQKGQERLKEIKVEGEREKEREVIVIVRREIVSPRWKKWNHGNFSRDWNKNYSA